MDALAMPRGFSMLEVVIAMAIMLATLAAVMLASFGNQSLLEDGALESGARVVAKGLLAEEAARAERDFNLVNPIAATTGGYAASTSVALLPDYLTKQVSATASWTDALGRARSLTLVTLLADFEHALGGDTCSSALEGDWNAPRMANYALAPGDLLPGASAPGAPVTALDASHGLLYAAASTTSATTNPTLFLFDISNAGAEPLFRASLDNASASKAGLSAVHAVGTYLYAASAVGADFSTCTPGASCAQLQIVDASVPSAPRIVENYLLPTTSPAFVTGSGGQATGKALAYEDGLLFLGLTKTATGPEFNIIDVRDPTAPAWIGGYSVGRSVNAIAVRGQYAYLATDDNMTGGEAVVVLDITDPSSPVRVASWSASGAGFAKSIAVVGATLYLGRTYASGSQKEFYVLDASSVANGLATLGSADIGTVSHRVSVNAVVVRDTLAFLLTTSDFELWNIADPSAIGPAIPPLALPPGALGTALDCEGNTLYVGSGVGAEGYLSVVTAH
jgi:prepilin-type N-terminal cleavage/methylation domain-containing protein